MRRYLKNLRGSICGRTPVLDSGVSAGGRVLFYAIPAGFILIFMALPLWGQLEKAQDDSTTIDEAIAAAILAHEADPEAHLGEGESLEEHKTESVIDHPAESVVTDKVPDGGMSYRWFPLDRQTIISNMGEESWDTFVLGNGGVEQYIAELELRSGTTSGNRTKASSNSGVVNQINWNEDWTFQTTVSISDAADNKVTFGFCNTELDTSDFDGVWFRYEDGSAYVGMSEDFGTETTHSITAWSTGYDEAHVFRIQYDSENDRLLFYIDGSLVYTWNSPSHDANTTAVGGWQIESLSTSQRAMRIYDMFLDVARPGVGA